MQKTSESLAGRVGFVDLTPFQINELQDDNAFELNTIWFRGGFPDSYLAISDEASNLWQENYIRTFVERDIFYRLKFCSFSGKKRLHAQFQYRSLSN